MRTGPREFSVHPAAVEALIESLKAAGLSVIVFSPAQTEKVAVASAKAFTPTVTRTRG